MAYTKNSWQTGDIVSSVKLNHMEDGIAAANESLIRQGVDGEGSPVNGATIVGDASNLAYGINSHAEGMYARAYAQGSHAEGITATAGAEDPNNPGSYIGDYAHAEGGYTLASGTTSHAEGYNTYALNDSSHAEGSYAKASGRGSHAEGSNTEASGAHSHAEGNYGTASGEFSHAEGNGTEASGKCSHAEGRNTIAARDYQHVSGKYNISDSSTYLVIVGNGTSKTNRSNALAIKDDGTLVVKGTSGMLEFTPEMLQRIFDAYSTQSNS